MVAWFFELDGWSKDPTTTATNWELDQ
ncbi:uncharacterized protein METZ01_LOCUS50801 [marine metagenome]|uniref:Uncharacterized protein n=1 Tax=marine metagenome TaxID=408172 RepID=A0A381S6R2_9ZZZZ